MVTIFFRWDQLVPGNKWISWSRVRHMEIHITAFWVILFCIFLFKRGIFS